MKIHTSMYDIPSFQLMLPFNLTHSTFKSHDFFERVGNRLKYHINTRHVCRFLSIFYISYIMHVSIIWCRVSLCNGSATEQHMLIVSRFGLSRLPSALKVNVNTITVKHTSLPMSGPQSRSQASTKDSRPTCPEFTYSLPPYT